MFACPMQVRSAFGLTPAIIIDAHVWRHSWSRIGVRPAARPAVRARRYSAVRGTLDPLATEHQALARAGHAQVDQQVAQGPERRQGAAARS